MAKKSKIFDALMRAFKAKDAEEVEKLAKEVADEGEIISGGEEGGDTHIHIHSGGATESSGAVTGNDEEGETGRAKFTDEDLQAHIDQNAAEHAAMMERIEALEAKLNGGETSDEESMPEEAMDEFPEEVKEEAAKAKDSAYLADSFQDTVAMAEILAPGIRVPTFDRAAKPGKSFKQVCNLRRQALDLAYVQPATRGILDELLGGKPLNPSSMTCDAVRSLFRSAAAMKRVANNGNSGRTGDVLGAGVKQAGPTTLAEINRRNAERWGKK